MSRIQVSCVTGTINRLDLLKRLVESVRVSVGQLNYELVIVDNNSTDGTAEWLKGQPDVLYLNVGEPRGAVAAFQMGFEACHGEYVVTLNDDIAVEGQSIEKAHAFMEAHPEVGQIAFGHKYQNRRGVSSQQPVTQTAFGYLYAQCGMTRRRLGDLVRWCGPEEAYTHYAWDTRLSLAIWELGYRVVPLDGCCVIDWEHNDNIRQRFSEEPRASSKGHHPDSTAFYRKWRGRLPRMRDWIPAATAATPGRRVLAKAAAGQLRTLRLKAMMRPTDPIRTTCIDAFALLGPVKQVNQNMVQVNVGGSRYVSRILEIVEEWQPDLVMAQAQSPNSMPARALEVLKERMPGMFLLNWDADTHYPLQPYHFRVAKASDLQGLISPTLFPQYKAAGAHNVCYWPIGVEREFLAAVRDPAPGKLVHDVIFLGGYLPTMGFPEQDMRAEAVQALHRAKGVRFRLHGHGWGNLGISTTETLEAFELNAGLYTQSKMALAIFQSREMWGYTSDRLYNICATGCPALIQRFAGMEAHGFVDGETCIAWSTLKEMMEKARYYLRHDEEREQIGLAGREVVHTRHTWGHRISSLMTMLEGFDFGW